MFKEAKRLLSNFQVNRFFNVIPERLELQKFLFDEIDGADYRNKFSKDWKQLIVKKIQKSKENF